MSADETDEEAAAFYQPQVDDYCLVRFRSVVYLIKVIKLYPKSGDMKVTFYRAFDRGMATSFSMEAGKGWGRIPCECHLKDVEKPRLGRRATFLLSKEDLNAYINSDDKCAGTLLRVILRRLGPDRWLASGLYCPVSYR